MNERIKQLAEQARLGRGPEKIQIRENGVVIFYLDELEKFAELIVRECAGLLQKEAESNHDEGSLSYNVLLQESNWMKRYFGVEE